MVSAVLSIGRGGEILSPDEPLDNGHLVAYFATESSARGYEVGGRAASAPALLDAAPAQ